MNRTHYQRIIRNHFGRWLGDAFGADHGAFLLQDHERCPWTSDARSAMRSIGLSLLEGFPKCSQDLNPIECVWKILRDRLAEFQQVALHVDLVFLPEVLGARRVGRQRRAD